ncbi:DUF4286 family protein [Paraburkholderia sp. HD33-4]|uniref:DUF4286 family protein n=1 Tax=Paraburkholderia sp. HD33-4 TaxID=2883242 RepID=UPI001F257D92|nr:DUF4286 family protein [Paraburkholderia sp. HD33-4]
MSHPARPALLMVSMEPPASLEEEFNDWYDTEHFPQRLALPGFVSASRWTCVDGWPRWMALYDLSSLDALDSDAYRGVSGAHSTPWSRRLLPRTVGRSRVAAVALDGQAPAQHDSHAVSRLLALSVPLGAGAASAESIVDAVREALAAREDLLQLRGFVEDGETVWILAAFDSPATSTLAAEIGRPCGCGIRTFNVYVPYRRSSY